MEKGIHQIDGLFSLICNVQTLCIHLNAYKEHSSLSPLRLNSLTHFSKILWFFFGFSLHDLVLDSQIKFSKYKLLSELLCFSTSGSRFQGKLKFTLLLTGR